MASSCDSVRSNSLASAVTCSFIACMTPKRWRSTSCASSSWPPGLDIVGSCATVNG